MCGSPTTIFQLSSGHVRSDFSEPGDSRRQEESELVVVEQEEEEEEDAVFVISKGCYSHTAFGCCHLSCNCKTFAARVTTAALLAFPPAPPPHPPLTSFRLGAR